MNIHDGIIKWKHFLHYWPFVQGIHQSPVNSPHKGQWHGALMFSLNCVWINGWVNNREASDLRRYRGHYDVIVMISLFFVPMTYLALFLSAGECSIKNIYCQVKTWFCNDMETLSTLLALSGANPLEVSPHKGPVMWNFLMFLSIIAWMNCWTNNQVGGV